MIFTLLTDGVAQVISLDVWRAVCEIVATKLNKDKPFIITLS